MFVCGAGVGCAGQPGGAPEGTLILQLRFGVSGKQYG